MYIYKRDGESSTKASGRFVCMRSREQELGSLDTAGSGEREREGFFSDDGRRQEIARF